MTEILRRSVVSLLIVGAVAAATAKEVPFLSGRVNDLAGLLSDATRSQLEDQLEALESDTGAQVAVLTVPSLEGEVLEDYTLRVAETWKLGRGKFDDGALLLIARDERQMRLEVGYGLEGTIPDIYAKRILDDIMRPRFRSGDFDGGVVAAVDAISGLVRGDASLPGPGEEGGPPGGGGEGTGFVGLFFLVPLWIFSFQALVARRGVAWFLYFLLMPFWLIFPMSMFGAPAGYVPLVLWIVGFPILRRVFGSSNIGGGPPGAGGARSGPVIFGPGGGWSSSRGGWGGGFGGGFSGGGGGFGGGGASGSW